MVLHVRWPGVTSRRARLAGRGWSQRAATYTGDQASLPTESSRSVQISSPSDDFQLS